MPGVFKNAVDWLSRPPADIGRVFGGKPVAVLGASPGGFGTVLSQNAWLPVLRTLGTTPWYGGRILVSRAGSVFDEAGRLASDTTKEQLRPIEIEKKGRLRALHGLQILSGNISKVVSESTPPGNANFADSAAGYDLIPSKASQMPSGGASNVANSERWCRARQICLERHWNSSAIM
jgi:hypothetical protein